MAKLIASDTEEDIPPRVKPVATVVVRRQKYFSVEKCTEREARNRGRGNIPPSPAIRMKRNNEFSNAERWRRRLAFVMLMRFTQSVATGTLCPVASADLSLKADHDPAIFAKTSAFTFSLRLIGKFASCANVKSESERASRLPLSVDYFVHLSISTFSPSSRFSRDFS